ncbi:MULTISPECIES: phosphate-starvation-inducible protein PsiE [unclassified Lysinibacillus]|uniref:phosphate-starvation-inducible protein PsiE n=1 Tax=unclassified Lysinibacillus TaxID=2636778 RepID=UPI001043558B|nr:MULTISPECIES: phosphate-starvation-inducible protein PsiE [unclassified Lysinibacillus]MDD1501356.1 phosphate-starvation-inducible protein PsiE [Lysinibacillus sp. CNPSo 3705]UPW83265.1 phosphate-starvation-inducible protein PsiE [Lysinibacillus sp. Ag94]
MAKAVKAGKITPERLEEALNVRDRLIIELLVQVLDEKLVIERPVLRERVANLVDLSDYDEELKETIHAVINKL